MRTYSRTALVSAALLGCSLMGLGCKSSAIQPAAPLPVSGVKPAVFDNLSPKDAALKINLVSPDVIVMHQQFTGPGLKIAQELGLGPEVERSIVITGFAPARRADFDWTASTTFELPPAKKGDAPKMEHRQYTGAMLGGNLMDGHELFSPSYLVDGEQSAYSTSLIWLSSENYVDLTKNQVTTLSPGLAHDTLYKQVKGSASLIAAAAALDKSIDKVIDRTDVYLTKAEVTSTVMTIVLNGKATPVAVTNASNWFGSFVFLNNPNNPLILKMTFNPDHVGGLAGFLDYEVTELRDLTES